MNTSTVGVEEAGPASAMWALDVDAHEMAPSHLWGEMFGSAGERIAKLVEPILRKVGALENGHTMDFYNPSVLADETSVTHQNVWGIRGVRAPGAFDFRRRINVLDMMGVQRQLVFPSFALFPLELMSKTSKLQSGLGGIDMDRRDIAALGRQGLDEYNAWVVRQTAADTAGRLRFVAYLPPTSSVGDLMTQAVALVDSGIRALHVGSGEPLGGRSPAHPELDAFWSLLAARDVVCACHVGGEGGFMASDQWVQAPAFAPGKVESIELGLEPYSFATLHLSICNWLTCMTLGGVFERHPHLRFGAIETGAHWLGPLADSLDMWARDVYARRLSSFLTMLPSEYLARNVRVTPFNNFEPVDQYIERYPHLTDCYCFSTDYPHVEGGTFSRQKLLDRVSRLGKIVVNKFFFENGNWLLPE